NPNTSARRTLIVSPLRATVLPYRLARSWVWTASEAASAASIGFGSLRSVEGRCNGEPLVGRQLGTDRLDYAILHPHHARTQAGLDQHGRRSIDLRRVRRRQALRDRDGQPRARLLDCFDMCSEL